MQWMSNRLGPPISPPAQLMYGDDHGTRLTVYVQPMGIDGEEFRYTQKGDARTIVWAERRLARVATGNLTEVRLIAVAYRVQAAVDPGGAP